jgi:hypothetical protein
VEDLVAEGLDLLLGQGVGSGDVLIAGGVLGDESALADDVAIGLEAFVAAELVDIGEKGAAGDADEGVLDPAEG